MAVKQLPIQGQPARREETQKAKPSGAGLGSIIGSIGGGIAGGLASGGVPQAIIGGASVGGTLGGAIGGQAQPAQAPQTEITGGNTPLAVAPFEEASRGQLLLDGIRVAQQYDEFNDYSVELTQAYMQSMANLGPGVDPNQGAV